MIKNKNFSNNDPTLLPLDSEYFNCNFTHSNPDKSGADPVGIRLWPGNNTPRKFTNCNLTNCEPPPGSILINCNTTICETRVFAFSDDLVIDNVVQHTENYYDTIIYGHWTTQGYDREGFPQTLPEDY